MKKSFLIFLLCIATAVSLNGAVKNTQQKNNSKVEIIGYIVGKGNEPFVFPVIRTEDDTEYMIICKDKVKQKLINAQGYKIKFTGTINEEGFFVLKKWKKV